VSTVSVTSFGISTENWEQVGDVLTFIVGDVLTFIVGDVLTFIVGDVLTFIQNLVVEWIAPYFFVGGCGCKFGLKCHLYRRGFWCP
jgi:hypothetical protein